ncbi:minichromosome maintenance protein MCM [Candidatus Bathyarchaeota archaeon]|nr:MAG: minichromosome maintenance protein MCM [Candidatus Bathyarchaeota archaeon]
MAQLESVEQSFTQFIEDFTDKEGRFKYDQEISELSVKGEKSFVIDLTDLYSFDMDLAQMILEDPEGNTPIFTTVIRSKLRTRDPIYAESLKRINIRYRNLPADTQLRKIGSDHIGRLVMLHGIIVRASAITPLVMRATFMCSVCGELNHLEQSGVTLQRPQKCLACDNRKSFELVPKESVFIDSQLVTIQERPEDLPPGQLPRSINVELKDDIVDIARPGDRITLTGFIKLIPKFGRGGELRTFDLNIDASFCEVSGRESELLELSPEDEEAIQEIAKDPFIHQKLLNSIAPSIYGNDYIKEAVLYLLLSGVSKDLEDMKIRGDINVLLVGDPGTAKSQMLSFAAKVAPRGLMTTGRGSTAAGLTAAVVKEGGTGNFVLEAGALVLADKGICCIDEIDKMREEDRGAIHPAMEQQIVPIAKGGIVATLNARCSILAAANPTLGRYNPYQTIGQNITLPVTILSRFDIIFILRDIPNSQIDSEIAGHILGLHRDLAGLTPPLNIQLMRKFISYAKTIKPRITDPVVERFQEFYVKMRNASVEGGEASAIAITARQLESLVRLAEARARAHLRTEVTIEDAEGAINLMQKSLEQVGIDVTTGQIDIDILYTGKPRSLQNQLQKVLQIVSEMERVSGSVKETDLYESLSTDYGINRSEGARLISVLMKDGTIYMPRPGYYRRTD